MRAFTRPNDEPPRTLLQILDDAIELENQFQNSQSGNSSSSRRISEVDASSNSNNSSQPQRRGSDQDPDASKKQWVFCIYVKTVSAELIEFLDFAPFFLPEFCTTVHIIHLQSQLN